MAHSIAICNTNYCVYRKHTHATIPCPMLILMNVEISQKCNNCVHGISNGIIQYLAPGGCGMMVLAGA